MPRLVMLVGLPGSGKSTYRKNLLNDNPNTVVICPDDFLEEKAAQMGISYQEIWLPEHHEHIAQSRIDAEEHLMNAVKNGQDIIWDQTNISFDMRSRRLDKVSDDYERIGVAFETNENTLFARNQDRVSRGRHLPEPVLMGMIQDYERPHFDEGFDHIVLIENNGHPKVL